MQSSVQLVANSNASSVEQFNNQFCGLNSIPNSNHYITEYKLPHACEIPLGIAIDGYSGKVWYVSTKHGTLGSDDLVSKTFDKEKSIPVWTVRQNPRDFSDVWSVKVDSSGNNIWFTDQKQNAIWRYIKSLGGFEMYKVPEKSGIFVTTSPVSIDFDSKGDVYFVGIHSPNLWFGNITQLTNGTSNGITKIPMPTDAFNGVDPNLISTGSVTVDNKKNSVWVSMLARWSKRRDSAL